MEHVKVVVAGHVDHGKSTLIGRLLYETGQLPQQMLDELNRPHLYSHERGGRFARVTDHFAEERANNLTIDASEARFKTGLRAYTLIDTPGHREFLRNMVTGATRADAAVLVVDAAEGIVGQTCLHAYLVAMLGIDQVIVVINKMDLVSYDRGRFERLALEVRDHLGKIRLEVVAAIPVAAEQGENLVTRSPHMAWYESVTLIEALDQIQVQRLAEERPLRVLVQCPFSTNRTRAVLGHVASGSVHVGQDMVFGPAGRAARVMDIKVADRPAKTACAGHAVALILDDPAGIDRGAVGFHGVQPPATVDHLRSEVFWIDSHDIEVGSRVAVLCGTQRSTARVERIEGRIDPRSLDTTELVAGGLKDCEIGIVHLGLDAPMCVDGFSTLPELGRLAIVQGGRVAGGGIVLM